MFCYILCQTPCAVKADGVYVGVASKNYTFLECDRCFLEFTPLDDSFAPISVLFDKNHPTSTKNVRIIDLYGGFLVFPQFFRKVDGEFKLLGKKHFSNLGNANAFCYNQGGIKLCISSNDDFWVESLPFQPNEVRFEACSENGSTYLFAFCISDKTEILGFKLGKDLTQAFKNLCDGYSLEKNEITTFEKKNDVLKHSITSTWQFGESVRLKNYVITRIREPFSLPQKLFKIAFFEELLLSGDTQAFLSPELKPRADELKEFLGDFTHVLPPPHFKDDDLVTLLYSDKVEYAKVEINNGLITNLALI